jgi:predicted DNA-binding transcriptional regulator YafY
MAMRPPPRDVATPRRAAIAKSGPRVGRPSGRFTQHRRLDKLRDVLTAHPSGLLLEDLASLLKVTTRSVRRYLGELDRATELQSVETTPGGAHIWRIKPSERGRTVALRRAQAYGLLAARRVFEPMKGSALYDELDVIMRQILQIAQRPTRTPGEVPSDNGLEDRFVYVPSPARSYGARVEELDELFQCVAELRVMRFRYRAPGLDGRGERVTSHPYALLVHRGAVFCVAHDVDQDAVRVFPFDRMGELHPSDHERFDLPAGFDASDFVHGDLGVFEERVGTGIRVLVEFEPRAADDVRARRFHPTQKIATAPDGRVRLSMTVPDLAELRAWVLGFGGAARVIEPPELAQDIVRELRRALGRYG